MSTVLSLVLLGAVIAAAVGYLSFLLRLPDNDSRLKYHDEHEDCGGNPEQF